MNLNEFAIEVHENSVQHGFYDKMPSEAEIIAAIHGEISEAWEEYRAVRPDVYYYCVNWENPREPDSHCLERGKQDLLCVGNDCCKPQGVAFELIDVCLRILDAAAALNVDIDISENMAIGFDEATLPEIVAYLHSRVSEVYEEYCKFGWFDSDGIFGEMITVIFGWLRARDLDPEALLLEKHKYNQSRSYRHGGKIF